MLSEKISRRHTEEELIADFNATGIEQQYYSLFHRIYNEFYEQGIKESKDFRDDEYGENESIRVETFDAAKSVFEDEYIPYLKMGHGEEWAKAMENYMIPDSGKRLCYAYNDIRNINPQLAEYEILTYFKNNNIDEHSKRYLLRLFDDYVIHDNAIEVSLRYSDIYKKQIISGKSEAYSDKYAELKASDENDELYCVKHALFYEEFGPEVYFMKSNEIVTNPNPIDSKDFNSGYEWKTKTNGTWNMMFPNGDEDDSITDYLTQE